MPYDSSLPAGTGYGKIYEHLIDVWDEALTPAPGFRPIRRADQIAPTYPPVTASAQTNDDLGAANEDIVGRSWSLAWRVIPARVTATQVLVAEYKILWDASVATGEDAVVRLRWYHAPASGTVGDPDQAFEGFATVSITPVDDNGLERWQITATGKGPFTKLASNPFDGRGVEA